MCGRKKGLKIFFILLAVVIVLAAAGFGVWYWWTHREVPKHELPVVPDDTDDTPEFTADGDLLKFDRPEAYASDLTWRQFYNATHELMEKLAEYGLINSPEALYDGSKGVDQDILLNMMRAGGFTREQLTQVSEVLLAAFDEMPAMSRYESKNDKTAKFLTVILPALCEVAEYVQVEQVQAAMRVLGEAKLDNIDINWSDKDGIKLWSQEDASRDKVLFSNMSADEREEYEFMTDGVSYSRKNAFYFMFDSDATYILLQSFKEMLQGFSYADSNTLADAIAFGVKMFSCMVNGEFDSLLTDSGVIAVEELSDGAIALGELLQEGVDNISDRLRCDLAYACLKDCEMSFDYYDMRSNVLRPLYYGFSEVLSFVADCLRGLDPEFLYGVKAAKQNVAQASRADYYVAYGELVARVGAFFQPYYQNMREESKQALCVCAAMFFDIDVSVDGLDSLFEHCAEIPLEDMTDADKEKIAEEYFDFESIESEFVSVKFDVDYPNIIALPAFIDDAELRERMLMYNYTFHDEAGVNEDRTKLLSFSLDSNEYGFATLTVSYPGYTITQAVYLYDYVEDNGEMIFDVRPSMLYGFTFETGNAPTEKTILDKILSNYKITMRTRDSWREISLDRYDYKTSVEFSVGDYDPTQAAGNYIGYVYADTWAGTWVMPFCYHIADANATQLCGFELKIKDQYLQDEQFEIRSASAIYDYGLFSLPIELSSIEVSGFDSSKAGKQMVTFTYRGYTITREILVILTHTEPDDDLNSADETHF